MFIVTWCFCELQLTSLVVESVSYIGAYRCVSTNVNWENQTCGLDQGHLCPRAHCDFEALDLFADMAIAGQEVHVASRKGVKQICCHFFLFLAWSPHSHFQDCHGNVGHWGGSWPQLVLEAYQPDFTRCNGRDYQCESCELPATELLSYWAKKETIWADFFLVAQSVLLYSLLCCVRVDREQGGGTRQDA